jgi:hypothetical protein
MECKDSRKAVAENHKQWINQTQQRRPYEKDFEIMTLAEFDMEIRQKIANQFVRNSEWFPYVEVCPCSAQYQW